MCRHLAYVGPTVSLGSLLLAPDHSLVQQSHAPRHQIHSTVNADGFGVAWWDLDQRPEPARYRSTRPIWADRNLPSMAGMIHASALIAAVRSATPPLPVDESATAPFVQGTVGVSLNGFVTDFRGAPGLTLRAMVSEARSASLEANNDGEVLAALVADAVDAGVALADAVADVVRRARSLGDGPLNLLATDGTHVAGTASGNSLFVLAGAGLALDGLLIASEPLDDHEAWRRVPEGSIVCGTATHHQIHALSDLQGPTNAG